MKNRIFYIVIIIAGFYACKNKPMGQGKSISQTEMNTEIIAEADHKNMKLSLTDFLIWCSDKDNAINKSKEIGELKYNLAYLPAEAMAFLELRRQNYDYNKFKTISESYENMVYFNFKMELKNGKTELLKHELQSPSQYEHRVKYISFDMQKDIYAVQGTDTIYTDLYQFERIFNAAPYSTVMMAFDTKKINKAKEFTIVYEDKLFGKGSIKFNYRNGQLINIPNVTGL